MSSGNDTKSGTTEHAPASGNRLLGGILGCLSILGLSILFYIDAVYYLPNRDTGSDGRIAGLLYLIVGVLVFGAMLAWALASFLGTMARKEPLRLDKVCYAIAFLLPIAAIYFAIGDTRWTDISGEGTYQLTLGLKLLHTDHCFGIFSVVYATGYVAREYVLAALPSYFFGPGLYALRVGNSYFYAISYLALLASLARYLKARDAARPLLLAAFCGSAFALSTYPIMYTRLFEQTSMPIGATCCFLAALFSYLTDAPKKHFGLTLLNLFWLTWALGFCADGYTPALATGSLALLILLYLVFIPSFGHPLLFIPIVHGAISMLNAGLMLHQNNATDKFVAGLSDFTLSDWIWRYFNGVFGLFSDERTLISYPLMLAFVVALYFSFKWRDFRIPALCLWCGAVFWASLSLLGSFFDSAWKEIHRGMIVLPFLSCAVVLFYHQHRQRISPATQNFLQVFAVISIFFLAYTSLFTPLLRCDNVFIDCYFNEGLEKVNALMHDPSRPRMQTLYEIPPLDIPGDFESAMLYFAPGVKIVLSNPPPGDTDPHSYVITHKSDNPDDWGYDVIVPSHHGPPYMRLMTLQEWFQKNQGATAASPGPPHP